MGIGDWANPQSPIPNPQILYVDSNPYKVKKYFLSFNYKLIDNIFNKILNYFSNLIINILFKPMIHINSNKNEMTKNFKEKSN